MGGGAAADTGDRLSMKERTEELGGFTVSSEGGGRVRRGLSEVIGIGCRCRCFLSSSA